MTDRELLELAAKAAGMHTNMWADVGELLPDKGGWVQFVGQGTASVWNPLIDDGDAFRLAVKLGIEITPDFDAKTVTGVIKAARTGAWEEVPFGNDPYDATRRAIVRAAAQIGEKQ